MNGSFIVLVNDSLRCSVKDHRSLSLWMGTVEEDLTPRPSLQGDVDVDVAIVGAGYTGLWTAYYLLQLDSTLRVALVESEIAGFGASGRNGGWCSALFAASKDRIAKEHGRDAAIALQRALFDTVDEVGAVCAREGIDAGYAKGGTLTFATTAAHLPRVKGEVDHEHGWGFGPDDFRWLTQGEARSRVDVSGALGAAFTPHCARLQPAALARGLARVVEANGATIYEKTPALALESGKVTTAQGALRADVVVRATEGYTPRLPRARRDLIPLYSLMIATEPLPAHFWDEVGWAGRETLTDGRHLLIYAQRTEDDRIAFGGRGAPYHFGSRIRPEFDRDEGVFAELRRSLVGLFPKAREARITHSWGGCLGVPRDWFSSVGFDRPSGLAWAGGYVGDGVATSNLAGRTLAGLITGNGSDTTGLPWVGHRSRKWEPEPLRWIGANLATLAMSSADRVEARTGRPARRAAWVGRFIGL